MVLPASGDTFFCAGVLGLLSPSQGSCPRHATLYVVSKAVDHAPIAGGDSYRTNEDTQLAVAAPGVLGNDSDPDGGAISALLVAGPAHASSFTLNADGSFEYTPVPDYNGPDSFKYEAGDGTSTAPSPPLP